MTIKVKSPKITKINFEVFPRTVPKEGERINVKINMNIKITDISKIDETKAKLLANFNCEIETFGKIAIDVRLICIVDNSDKLIQAIKNKKEKELDPSIMPSILNATFYFVMPIVMLISEKGNIPIPLPPIVTAGLQKKTNSTKSIQAKSKSIKK